MSVNSPSNSSSIFPIPVCHQSTASIVIYTVYTFANVLFLVPLYILVLYTGFQRWRRQRSASSAAPMSHSDFFTYNMLLVEMLGVTGSLCYTSSSFSPDETAYMLGLTVFSVVFPGQTLFHILTCVERYLAVVHAITYMRLRDTCGVRLRNISAACVWLLCLSWVGVTYLSLPDFPTSPLVVVVCVCLFVVFYLCLAVLRSLNRPGPGEVGGRRERADQSKQRAFNMIVAITGALLLRCGGIILCFGLTHLLMIDQKVFCAVMDAGLWLTVPSSLVLPLLFLHRSGKLPCCRRSSESG